MEHRYRHLFLCVIPLLFLGAGINQQEGGGAPKDAAPKKSLSYWISGRVLEKGTKNILAGVTLYIKETRDQAVTDNKGRFEIQVPPGTYTLTIPVAGYEAFQQQVVASPRGQNEPLFRLSPLIVNPYKIVVTSKKKRPEVSSQTIAIDEAVMTPGNNRDVLNVVTNMPGVSSISAFGGYGSGLVIRGAASEESSFFVDDHEIPLLYHFGGLESIIEPELVESIEYDAGGFSAEYGETLAGVVSLKLKEPRKDRLGGYVNMSLLSSSCMVEGPLSEKGSLAVSFKRGFIDIYTRMAMDMDEELKDEVRFLEYPTYSDGAILYSHEFSRRNKLKLAAIGAVENTELMMSQEEISPRISDKVSEDLAFSMVMAEWSIQSGRWKSRFSPLIGFNRFDVDAGSRAYFELKQTQVRFSEKLEYDLSKIQKLRFGGRIVGDKINLNSALWSRKKEGEAYHNPFENEINANNDGHLFTLSIYGMDQITKGDWMVTPGLHALFDRHTGHGYIDPRLLLTYQWSEPLILKGAMGLYSSTPELDESTEPWGTEHLEPERSLHTVAGFEYRITGDISLDLQAYYKKLFNMAVRSDPNDPTVYSNSGEGRIHGAEIFLKHRKTDRFFGWISYSWSVSKRSDANESNRYFSEDIPHNLKAVASYKLNRNWTLGGRYAYASGSPYTDLLNVETLYDVDNDQYIPLYKGSVNDDRLAARHQLDLRIDRMWLFDTWVLSLYLDVRNVLRQKIYIDQSYNKDYTESENEESLESVIPFVFLGMKIDF